MDKLDAKRRSENMRRIRSRDTSPEIAVRRITHSLGYRYRLHVADLPGKPDLVFKARGKIIFVHGCFWHQHRKCAEGRVPGSRRSYWVTKLANNMARDRKHQRTLKRRGWKILVVWECELRNIEKLTRRLTAFLGRR